MRRDSSCRCLSFSLSRRLTNNGCCGLSAIHLSTPYILASVASRSESYGRTTTRVNHPCSFWDTLVLPLHTSCESMIRNAFAIASRRMVHRAQEQPE